MQKRIKKAFYTQKNIRIRNKNKKKKERDNEQWIKRWNKEHGGNKVPKL